MICSFDPDDFSSLIFIIILLLKIIENCPANKVIERILLFYSQILKSLKILYESVYKLAVAVKKKKSKQLEFQLFPFFFLLATFIIDLVVFFLHGLIWDPLVVLSLSVLSVECYLLPEMNMRKFLKIF